MSLKAEASSGDANKQSRFTRDSFDEIVQVKVGPKATVFQMHKGLLCKAAPYFKKAFEGQFAEAQSQILELPEEDTIVFSHFQLWLYTDDFLQRGETESEITWTILISLYIFAEVRDICDLQNAAMDSMIDKEALENSVPTPHFNLIYEQTHENSPLRRIAIDWLTHLCDLVPAEWLAELNEDTFPKEALVDLVFAQYALRVGTKGLIEDFKAVRSDYHVKPPGTAVKA